MANSYKRTGRARKPKGRGWARFALKAGLIVLLACGLVYSAAWAAGKAWRSTASMGLFSVQDVRVSGIKHVRQADLMAYIGEVEGVSIFDVDLAGMVRKLEAHPWIKAASVKRELPDGVRLTLTERVPAAAAAAGPGRYIVDTDGFVLALVGDEGWGYLPCILSDSKEPPGAPGSGPHEPVVLALALLDAVRAEPTETLAGGVVHIGRDGVPYVVLDGAVVEVGGDGYPDKVRRLAEIFDDMHKRGISPSKIDLRFPGKVIVDSGRARQS